MRMLAFMLSELSELLPLERHTRLLQELVSRNGALQLWQAYRVVVLLLNLKAKSQDAWACSPASLQVFLRKCGA